MSTTKGSPNFGEQADPASQAVLVNPFTLRDLYVRASISGNSLAAELGRYLNIDESTFSSSSKSDFQPNVSNGEPNVHEQALAAILEVVTSKVTATFEYVRVPEPPGGVQEWWSRMLSGSMNNSQSSSDRPAIGENL